MCEIPQNSLVLPIDSDSAELPDVILMLVILFEAAVLKLFPVVPCTILSSAPPAQGVLVPSQSHNYGLHILDLCFARVSSGLLDYAVWQ